MDLLIFGKLLCLRWLFWHLGGFGVFLVSAYSGAKFADFGVSWGFGGLLIWMNLLVCDDCLGVFGLV